MSFGYQVLGVGAFTSGWSVTHSMDYERDSSQYLNRTMGTATDMQKCTMSCWVKKESLGFNSATFFGASTGQSYMNFVSGNEITLFGGVVSGTSGTNHPYMKTNATYGSTSDSYHIVVQVDTTQGTATDREKL